MKKVFLLSVLAILFANFSFGSWAIKQYAPVTKEDVWAYQIIQHNASVNRLSDPNLIFPGWSLYYKLPDGSDTITNIVKGDNQTKVVKRIIQEKNLLNPEPTLPVLPENIEPAKKGMSEFIRDFSWLAYVLVILFFLLFLFFIYNEISKKNRNSKNYAVTAGPAQVPGGVNDQGAYGRLNQIIASRFSNDTQQKPRNVRRTNVNGTFRVYYAKAPLWWNILYYDRPYSKVINIVDPIVAYAGEITVDGQDQTIYFLQPCGNDAVQGNYMVNESNPVYLNSDGSPVLANETQEVFEKDSASPEQIAEAKKSLEEKARIAKNDEVLIDVEVLKVASEHNAIAVDFLKTTSAHKVTLEVVLPSGASVTTILETKNQPGKTDKKTDEKTEGQGK